MRGGASCLPLSAAPVPRLTYVHAHENDGHVARCLAQIGQALAPSGLGRSPRSSAKKTDLASPSDPPLKPGAAQRRGTTGDIECASNFGRETRDGPNGAARLATSNTPSNLEFAPLMPGAASQTARPPTARARTRPAALEYAPEIRPLKTGGARARFPIALGTGLRASALGRRFFFGSVARPAARLGLRTALSARGATSSPPPLSEVWSSRCGPRLRRPPRMRALRRGPTSSWGRNGATSVPALTTRLSWASSGGKAISVHGQEYPRHFV